MVAFLRIQLSSRLPLDLVIIPILYLYSIYVYLLLLAILPICSLPNVFHICSHGSPSSFIKLQAVKHHFLPFPYPPPQPDLLPQTSQNHLQIFNLTHSLSFNLKPFSLSSCSTSTCIFYSLTLLIMSHSSLSIS